MRDEYEPFDYRITKGGEVMISRGGRQVMTVRGAAAAKLAGRLGVSDDGDQAALQRITGNYRRGNEN